MSEEKTLGEKLDMLYKLIENTKVDMQAYSDYHDMLDKEVEPLGLKLEYNYSKKRYCLISVSEA